MYSNNIAILYFENVVINCYIKDTDATAVNGDWTDWGSWGECSSSCGEGIKSRRRSCTAPSPMGSGKDCVGDATSNQACTKSACPGKLQYFYIRPSFNFKT